jgi:transcription initiation factor TFIID subunit 10
LTNHYLKSAGVGNPDARVTRLVSLAAERFVQQVADDAYRCAVQRNQAQLKEKKEKGYDLKDKRLVLESEDLAAALRDYGVSLHKPPYYVGSAPAEEEEEEKEEEKPSKKRSKR